MGTIYEDGHYLEFHPGWHEEDSAWKAAQIEKIISANKLSPRSICEIGCGAGEILRQLSIKFPSVQFKGYEISPQAYELAAAKASPTLRFEISDILNASRAPEAYDMILAIDVFEHVEDYFSFCRKMRSLAPYKIFHIPLEWTVETTLRQSMVLDRRKFSGHLHCFTKDTALAALSECGYDIVDWFYTPALFDLDRGRSLGTMCRKVILRSVGAINKDLSVRLLGGHSLLVLAR